MTDRAALPLLTADDLLRLPDDGPSYELVDGRLKELPVSKESSGIGGELFFYLRTYAGGRPGRGWVYPQDTAFRCFPGAPRTVRKPDVAFIAVDRMPAETYADEGFCTTVPDLVGEVVSPNDLAYDVEEKLREWLAAGVRLVWVVYPPARTVYAHAAGGGVARLGPADTLTGGGVLPGFAVPVAALFLPPGGPAAG